MSSIFTVRRLLKITNPKKLLGKPVANLAKTAKSVSADVYASIEDKKVSAKNLGKILSLNPKKDDVITFSIDIDIDSETDNKTDNNDTDSHHGSNDTNKQASEAVLDEMAKILLETDVAEEPEEPKETKPEPTADNDDKALSETDTLNSTEQESLTIVDHAAFAGVLGMPIIAKQLADTNEKLETEPLTEQLTEQIVANDIQTTSDTNINTSLESKSVKNDIDDNIADQEPESQNQIQRKDKVAPDAITETLTNSEQNNNDRLDVQESLDDKSLDESTTVAIELNDNNQQDTNKADDKTEKTIEDNEEEIKEGFDEDIKEGFDEDNDTKNDAIKSEPIETELNLELQPEQESQSELELQAKTDITSNLDAELENKSADEQSIHPVASWSDFVLPTTKNSEINIAKNKLSSSNKANHSLGTSASAGMAIAPAFIKPNIEFNYALDNALDNALDSDCTTKEQKNKLINALEKAKSDLDKIVFTTELDDIQAVFNSQRQLLENEQLHNALIADIENRDLSAPEIWAEHTADMIAEHSAQKQNTSHIRDLNHRVLKLLCKVEAIEQPRSPHILLMQEALPSDVASIDIELVAGILTAEGEQANDSAIVARALGIPMVVGAGSKILDIDNDTSLIVNGETGDFIINPDKEQIEVAKRQITKQVLLKTEAIKRAKQPAKTIDGHEIKVTASIHAGNSLSSAHNTPAKIAYSFEQGADDIGLLTLEKMYADFEELPDLAVQTEIYRQIFEHLEQPKEQPLTVQVLNISNDDTPLPYLKVPHEDNPIMGMRGIRLSLRQSDFFKSQLTALFNAGDNRYPIRLVLPMISQIEEWRMAKKLIDEVLQDARCDNLQIGIMVDVPAVALTSHIFANEVDFFCINIDTLAQYTLAADPNHPVLAKSADPLHPSVLSLIDLTIHNAYDKNKKVSLFGSLTDDLEILPLLVGMGVEEIIIHPNNTAMFKAQIRMQSFTECQDIKNEALSCEDGNKVRELIKLKN